jgi:hypothetical protein
LTAVVVAKKTSQGNYLTDDGAKIHGGWRHALSVEDMIGKQQRKGGGEGATTTVHFLQQSSNKKKNITNSTISN